MGISIDKLRQKVNGNRADAADNTANREGISIDKLRQRVADNRERKEQKAAETAIRQQAAANLGVDIPVAGGTARPQSFVNGTPGNPLPTTSGGAPLVAPAVAKEQEDFAGYVADLLGKTADGTLTQDDVNGYKDRYIDMAATNMAYATVDAAKKAEDERKQAVKESLKNSVGGVGTVSITPQKTGSVFASKQVSNKPDGLSALTYVGGNALKIPELQDNFEQADMQLTQAQNKLNYAWQRYADDVTDDKRAAVYNKAKQNYDAAFAAYDQASRALSEARADIGYKQAYAKQSKYYGDYAKAASDAVSDDKVADFSKSLTLQSAQSLANGGSGNGYSGNVNRLFLYGTDKQKKVYLYLLDKDKKAAEQFASDVSPLVNLTLQDAFAKDYEKQGKLGRFTMAALTQPTAGVNDFIQGGWGLIKALTGDDSYTFQTALQSAAGGVRSAEKGFAAGAFMDAARSAGNMAPAIAIGSVTGGIAGPAVGTAIQSIAFGGSAAGNAYIQAINDGYNHSEALCYGAISGASEVFLERLIGGVAGFGVSGASRFASSSAGKAISARITPLFGKAAAKLSPNVQLAFRTVGHAMADMSSEAVEESMQELLDPLFKNIIMREDNRIFTAENMQNALYAGLLGALTAGILNVPSNMGWSNTISSLIKGKATDADIDAVLKDNSLRGAFESIAGFKLPSDTESARMMLEMWRAGAATDFAAYDTATDYAAYDGKNAVEIMQMMSDNADTANTDGFAVATPEQYDAVMREAAAQNGEMPFIPSRASRAERESIINKEAQKRSNDLLWDAVNRAAQDVKQEAITDITVAQSRGDIARIMQDNIGKTIWVNDERRTVKGGSRGAVQTVRADGSVATDALAGSKIEYTSRGFVLTGKDGTKKMFSFDRETAAQMRDKAAASRAETVTDVTGGEQEQRTEQPSHAPKASTLLDALDARLNPSSSMPFDDSDYTAYTADNKKNDSISIAEEQQAETARQEESERNGVDDGDPSANGQASESTSKEKDVKTDWTLLSKPIDDKNGAFSQADDGYYYFNQRASYNPSDSAERNGSFDINIPVGDKVTRKSVNGKIIGGYGICAKDDGKFAVYDLSNGFFVHDFDNSNDAAAYAKYLTDNGIFLDAFPIKKDGNQYFTAISASKDIVSRLNDIYDNKTYLSDVQPNPLDTDGKTVYNADTEEKSDTESVSGVMQEDNTNQKSGYVLDGYPRHTITEQKHTKTGEPIYVLRTDERISDDEYKRLKDKIKEIGGYYSKFVKGFIVPREIYDAYNAYKGNASQNTSKIASDANSDAGMQSVADNEKTKQTAENRETDANAADSAKSSKKLLTDLSAAVNDILEMSDERAKELAEDKAAILIFEHTPDVILDNIEDSKDLPVIINFTKLYLDTRNSGIIKGNYHGLGENTAKILRDVLQNPMAIIRLSNGRLNLLSEVSASEIGNKNNTLKANTDEEKTMLVSVELNSTKDIDGKNTDYNVVVTLFSPDENYMRNLFSKDGVTLAYEKEDLPQVNPQLYKRLATINGKSSFNNSISQHDQKVNRENQENKKVSDGADARSQKVSDIQANKEAIQNIKRTAKSIEQAIKLKKDGAFQGADEKTLRALDSISRAFGVRVLLFDGAGENGNVHVDGFYDRKAHTMYLNAGNGARPLQATIRHELIHVFASDSPEDFAAFRSFVITKYKETYSESAYDAWIAEKQAEYALLGSSLDENGAAEDMCADLAMDMLGDENTVKEFVKNNSSAAERLLYVFRSFIDRLRRALGLSERATTPEQALLRLTQSGSTVRIADGKVERSHALYKNDTLPGALEIQDLRHAEALLFDSLSSIKTEKASKTNADLFSVSRITPEDVTALRSIGRKSVNDFTSEDIKKAEPFARKYWEEMGTKSPFFRAWFGDWRAYDDKTPVKTASEKGADRGTVKNEDTGWNIQVSAKVFNETKAHVSKANQAAIPYLDYINSIIKNAVLLDSYSIPDAKAKSINSVMMHSLYAIADIGNRKELLKLYIEELNDVNNDGTIKRAYQLQNIIKIPAESVRVQSHALSSLTSSAEIEYSVSNLFSLVKRFDKNFHPQPVSPDLLNEDGTPKILYHQTAADFTVFKTDNPQAGKNDSETPNGIFFKDNDHDIGLTGKKQMTVYLNMKKPLHFKDRHEANAWYCEHIDGYRELQDEMNKALRPFSDSMEKLEDQMFADETDDEQYEKLDAEWNKYLENMKKVETDYHSRLRDLLNAYFLENDSEYDGIILDYDGHRYVNGKREDVKTYIVFSENQIKSATDNIGTFDGTNPDIRYSTGGKNIDKTDETEYTNSIRKDDDNAQGRTEFRRIQEEARTEFARRDKEQKIYARNDEGLRRRLAGILSRRLDDSRFNSGYDLAFHLRNEKYNTEFTVYSNVDGETFRDVFEIARAYTENGELVDLHGVDTTDDGIGYNDCKNYITDDGLSGFSITPDGDLISVFNANSKRGFLEAISKIVKKEAKTLDCYKSPNQDLMEMYERKFGFKTASIMDYNMEYDHDDIAKNHEMPKVAFMVNTDEDVETKNFSKDQYDQAVDYRNGFVKKKTDDRSSGHAARKDEINARASWADSDFTRIQEASRRLSDKDVKLFHSGGREIDERLRRRLSGVFARRLESERSRLRYDTRILNNAKTGKPVTILKDVNAKTFHDIFEIVQKFLKNGDAVDVHDVDGEYGYAGNTNFLSSTGLSGFSITPTGDLVSVFSLGEKGFLRTIRNYVKSEGAVTLDCYQSEVQPLADMYQKTLGMKTASLLDFNYDILVESKGKDYADYFVRTYGEAPVAFMVNADENIEAKHFTKDQYIQAVAYRDSFIDKNTAGNSDGNTRTSEKDSSDVLFSYEALIAKKDMAFTDINTSIPRDSDGRIDRKGVANLAMQAVRESGNKKNTDTDFYVHVDDTKSDLKVSIESIRHGLTRKPDLNAIASLNLVGLAKNAVLINKLSPRKGTDGGNVYLSAGKDSGNNLYFVRLVTDKKNLAISEIETVYAINAKKESVAHYRQGYENTIPFAFTDSVISIAKLLDFVKNHFSDILPESVLRHYNISRKASPVSGSVMYSLNNDKNSIPTIPRGENPARDVEVRAFDENGGKVSEGIRTVLESKATPDSYVSPILSDIAEGKYSHDVTTDKKALSDAKSTIERDGYRTTLDEMLRRYENGQAFDKKDLAVLQALYAAAAQNTDYLSGTQDGVSLAEKLITAMVDVTSRAGQTLQAARLLKKLSPEGMLYSLNMTMREINRQIEKQWGKWTDKENNRIETQWGAWSERTGKRKPDMSKEGKAARKESRRSGRSYSKKQAPLVLSEELTQKLLNARTPYEASRIADEIETDLARQILSSPGDKLRNWRYLSMLFNPRTHVRNIVGNFLFAGAVKARDTARAVLEAVLIRDSEKRTTSLVIRAKQRENYRALKEYAKNLFDEQTAFIKGESSRYDVVRNGIEEKRSIFRILPLEKMRKINSGLLEAEDVFFIKGHFVNQFSREMLAKNITVQMLENGSVPTEVTERAVSRAAYEAQKATFRDANAVAAAINRFSKTNALTDFAVAGILPFKKTPMNILRRGIEYSPVSLIKGTYETIMQNVYKKNGTIEEIDTAGILSDFSQGLTGSALFVFGCWLASLGILSVGGDDDDKKDALEKAAGHQNYALELFGYSVTLDWAAPMCMPLFAGAEFFRSLEEKEFSLAESLLRMTDPVLETSMMSGVLDLIQSASFANGASGQVTRMAQSVMESYALQYFPSVIAATARTFDEVESRTSRADASGDKAFLERVARKIISKSVLLRDVLLKDYNKPYVDVLGNYKVKQAPGDYILSVFQNFLLPCYVSRLSGSEATDVLTALVESSNQTDFLPGFVTSFEVNGKTHRLTHDEYFDFHTMRGEMFDDILPALNNQKWYKSLTAYEKAKVCKKFKETADSLTKKRIDEDYGIKEKKLDKLYSNLYGENPANGEKAQMLVLNYLKSYSEVMEKES